MDENIRFVQILDLLKKKGVITDYVQAASILETNKAAISDIKARRKKLSIEILRRLKNSYHIVNLDWVIMGKGEPFVPENKETQSMNTSDLIEKIAEQAEEIGRLKEVIRHFSNEKENSITNTIATSVG